MDPVNENYKKLLTKFGENLGRNLEHRARRLKRSATDRYGIGMSTNLRGAEHMSCHGKVQLLKYSRVRNTKIVHVTPTGRISIKKKRVRRRKKKKASFVQLFRCLLDDAPLEHEVEDTIQPSSSSTKPQPACKTYAEKRKSCQQAWANQRQGLLTQFVETEVLPDSATCHIHGCSEPPTWKCSDCGRGIYFCTRHVVTMHQRKLHLPSYWKDGSFSVAFIKQDPWKAFGTGHQCDSQKKQRQVVVIDIKGRQHSVPIVFCGCWTDAQQLVRLRLWPGTPTRPEVAFHWDLMIWLRVMSLECHSSLKSLCEALYWLSPPTLPTLVKNPYSMLSRDCFAEFKFLTSRISGQQFFDGSSSVGHPVCPACPKTGEKRIVSLDAMFGLKRWRKSGESILPPRYQDTFFLDQTKVDSYVKGYNKQTKATEQNCSSFQAGNMIHTDKTSGRIDETGLFGAVCRHEMPLYFFNLKQGEQIANAVYLISHLLAESPTTKLYVLYDIACMLAAHLRKSGQTDILSQIALAVPAFHIYGHKPSCQMLYSTRRVDGFALSDGEQVERLWSYLRNFSRSTKEMTASNRIDAITDALLHYSRKRVHRMGEIFLQRSFRAEESLRTAKSELADALKSQNHEQSSISEGDIERWILEKSSPSPVQALATGHDLSPDEIYALHLSTYYDLCDEIEKDRGSDNYHTQILSRKVSSMSEQLKTMERSDRWKRDDTVYLDALRKTEDRKRIAELNRIHTMVVERWFLLLMKRKYADGQKIAKRLCIQVKKVAASLRKAVSSYGSTFKLPSFEFPNTIPMDVAFDIKSSFWECLFPNKSPTSMDYIPVHVKRVLMDAFHRVQHSQDEIDMLKAEMTRLCESLSTQHEQLALMIQQGSISAGQRCVLSEKQKDVHHQLYMVYCLFKDKVALPPVEEPDVVQSVSWITHRRVEEKIDMPISNIEDDEDTALDEAIDAADDLMDSGDEQ